MFVPESLRSWLQPGTREAWQGHFSANLASDFGIYHVVHSSNDVSSVFARDRVPAVLSIRGTRVELTIAGARRQFDLAIDLPCRAELSPNVRVGAAVAVANDMTFGFTILDGKLVVGGYPVGIRRGKTALVCVDARTAFVLNADGSCWRVDKIYEAATCTWSTLGGKDKLTVTYDFAARHDTAELIANGDSLVSDTFLERVKTLAFRKIDEREGR